MEDNEYKMFQHLKHLMDEWAIWVRSYKTNLGWRSKTVGLESGYTSKSFEELFDGVELEVFKKIDAAVEDLSPQRRAAIKRCYGMSKSFPFERYQEELISAHRELLGSLPKMGVVITS